MHERLWAWFVLGEEPCCIHSAIRALAYRIVPHCAQFDREVADAGRFGAI
jgi:hypothetical protein